MWSDESRCVLFQSDGHIRRSRQACEMMHTSCVVPATYKPGGVLRSDVGLMRLLRLKSCNAVYP